MLHSRHLIITYAIALHLVWAIALFYDPAAGNATAVHTLILMVGRDIATWSYFVGAGLAVLGLILIGPAAFLCLLPQQFIMMVSAGGALWAMHLGQFADGVQRDHAFLIADQSPAVIAATLHTVAIFTIIRARKPDV